MAQLPFAFLLSSHNELNPQFCQLAKMEYYRAYKPEERLFQAFCRESACRSAGCNGFSKEIETRSRSTPKSASILCATLSRHICWTQAQIFAISKNWRDMLIFGGHSGILLIAIESYWKFRDHWILKARWVALVMPLFAEIRVISSLRIITTRYAYYRRSRYHVVGAAIKYSNINSAMWNEKWNWFLNLN